ncbi:hypothetical protein F4559_002368 [Saccharothrix violaceirubra]|uniref:Uncharacterized protein n=1 Tax=Saccharothrix violaceirubra TaxID=413306 RepID=A0A7W7T1T4_9PSEU|nr:hypothetical protein [Saccharothrix violaceirubra]
MRDKIWYILTVPRRNRRHIERRCVPMRDKIW